eukprot:5188633-Pyramimonas_sp.AAC.1
MHAADVAQRLATIVTKCELQCWLPLDDCELFAMLLAAIVHDYQHPGTNNAFQVRVVTSSLIRATQYELFGGSCCIWKAMLVPNYHIQAPTLPSRCASQQAVVKSSNGSQYQLVGVATCPSSSHAQLQTPSPPFSSYIIMHSLISNCKQY